MTARGDRREAIYEDDADRQQFPVLLGEVVADFNWRCHAYCLIDHYHLAVETSDGNLSKGMHGLNGVFTQASKSAWRTGHLLQGRYKTVLVDDSHHLELTRYVVLNSVCAGMVTAPGDWPWSSYRATMGADATHTRVAASVGFMVTFVADIYPSGRRIEYERDILGRITAVRAEVAGTMQPLLSDIRYRADGQLTSARFGNGLNQVRQYDRQGRLLEQRLFDDSGTILDLRQYRYDPAGNLTARTGTPGDQQYDYDALDRLIGQRIAANDQDWQYAYDANHNRQQRSDGVLNEVYGYRPNSNRLTEIDRLLASTPDPAAPRSKRFEYNQAGRLAEYREDGQSIARYTYNALGQRTRKELEHETRLYHYDNGIQLLSETDAEGKPIKDYVWLDNEPLAQIEATGTVVYLHTDHLLTPRLGSSDARQIVWRWEGEAFGDAEAQGPMEVNLRFPGQYFDAETGQHYNYFRDYDPNTGRYVQSDPVGLRGGPNEYAYVFARPLLHVDPFGLKNTVVCSGDGKMKISVRSDNSNGVCGLGKCLIQHEACHVQDMLTNPDAVSFCNNPENNGRVISIPASDFNKRWKQQTELKCSQVEKQCLEKEKRNQPTRCLSRIQNRINVLIDSLCSCSQDQGQCDFD